MQFNGLFKIVMGKKVTLLPPTPTVHFAAKNLGILILLANLNAFGQILKTSGFLRSPRFFLILTAVKIPITKLKKKLDLFQYQI